MLHPRISESTRNILFPIQLPLISKVLALQASPTFFSLFLFLSHSYSLFTISSPPPLPTFPSCRYGSHSSTYLYSLLMAPPARETTVSLYGNINPKLALASCHDVILYYDRCFFFFLFFFFSFLSWLCFQLFSLFLSFAIVFKLLFLSTPSLYLKENSHHIQYGGLENWKIIVYIYINENFYSGS